MTTSATWCLLEGAGVARWMAGGGLFCDDKGSLITTLIAMVTHDISMKGKGPDGIDSVDIFTLHQRFI